MENLPRPNIRTADDPGINLFIEPTTDFVPEKILSTNQQPLLLSIDKAMREDSLSDLSYLGMKQKYEGSSHQKNKYAALKEKDPLYAAFISKNYGTYQNFLFVYRLVQEQETVYDPLVDHKIDVTVITNEVYYKSDHISAQELIMEALYGVCTVDYIDVNNNVRRLNGTLEKKYMIGSKASERYQFFMPSAGKFGEKVVLWDVNRQKWSSFYLSRTVRFVKDDTLDLE